jgi:SulP family sulfate permease
MQLFNEINLRNIRGDVFGGITAAVIALPMALAFGVASGAGAEAGLYGAILVGLFAALFGGSPCLMSEPTGPMTVVFTAVIAKLIASDPANGMAMAFTVVILAGLFQILLGVLRLGKYVTLMPYTVVSGFMSGIGIILIILQLAPSLGEPVPAARAGGRHSAAGNPAGRYHARHPVPDACQADPLHPGAAGRAGRRHPGLPGVTRPG